MSNEAAAPCPLIPMLRDAVPSLGRRSDSRIPEAAFGTAEEDALRRDFTINALFFNVNTWSVEDMTKR